MLTISRPSSGGGGGGGSWGSITGTLSNQTDLAAALAAKLDKAGGTMTGVLTAAAGSVSAPAITFTGAGTNTGIYSTGANTIDFAIGGVRRVYIDLNGTINTNGSGLTVTGGNILATNTYLRLNGPALRMGAADDLVLGRFAAAGLQLGTDHATTATNQTIKAHNVTTGSGANLTLCGGTGSVSKGAVTVSDATDMPAGFHGYSCPQQGPGGSAATHTPGIGAPVTEDSNFNSYSIGQIVIALQQKGILA